MTGRTQLSVDLVARVGGFEAGMKRAAGAASSASSRISDTLGRVGPAVAAGLATIGVAAAAATKSAIDRADDLSKTASRIGIGIEALSGLSFAAELSDVSIQQLQGGLSRLVRAQESAASGQGDLASLFETLGIKAADAGGKLRATEDVLGELADVFQALPDGPEKAALALDLFGRSGQQLIPLLNQGSEGIREATREAEQFGLVLDAETGRAAEEFNDQLTRLGKAWEGFSNQLASNALPTLRSITDALVDVAKAASQALASEGLFADDFFSRDSGLIAQLYRDRGFEAPGLINTGDGPTLTEVLGGARNTPQPIEFITFEDTDAQKRAKEIEEALAKRRKASEAASRAARDAAAAERAFAEAQREAARAAKEAEQAAKEQARAREDFNATVADYQAALDGPIAQAELEWSRRQAQLNDLAARGQISAEQLASALGVLSELRTRDIDAINAQLSPAEQVIADLQEELRLLGLSNTEREIANALRYAGVDAMSEEGQQIGESIRLLEEARERLRFSEDIRSGFEDTFASIIDGSKSAKQAFEDLGGYITQLIARRLGAQLVDSLLGPAGSPLGAGGGGGNFLTSILGSLFGGGRAAGGWVAPGKMYEVAENGPELLRVGNRQFLLPTATGGMVTPNARMGGGGGVVQNINVQGRIDTRTAAQLARETQRAQSRAAMRFGA